MDSKESDGAPDPPGELYPYLDEKLDKLLGHFREDFKGHLSKETLGSKYGGYGSFLPAELRPVRGPNVSVPSVNKTQNAPQKPAMVPKQSMLSGPNTITRNPSDSLKPQNGPLSTMQNSSDKLVKTSENLVKPSDNSVKSSDNLVKPSEKPVKPSGDSVKELAPKLATESKEKRSLIIRIKVGPTETKERKVNCDIQRGKNKNAELYTKLGLESSPSQNESLDKSADESPEMILKKVTSSPIKGKQTLSPLKSKVADLCNKTTFSFAQKMKPCSKLSSHVKITDNGRKLIKETCNAKKDDNQERESLNKERESKTPSQVKKIELNASVSNGKGKEKVSSLKTKNNNLGVKPSLQFKVMEKKRPTICSNKDKLDPKPSRAPTVSMLNEKKKERKAEESQLIVPNGKKATVEKDATRMAASEKDAEDPAGSTSADNWVQCDHCKKWRMLPQSISPDDLPDKWLCRMINWLGDGMNSCKVSEEETTNAINALYFSNSGPFKNDPSLAPAGQVPVLKNGTQDVVASAGTVPKNGMKVTPAGTVPKNGTKDVEKPAGTVKAVPKNGMRRPDDVSPNPKPKSDWSKKDELKKVNAKKNLKDIEGPAGDDPKLKKKRVMDQPADDARASKKQNRNEPVKKPVKKDPEPVKAPKPSKKGENSKPNPPSKRSNAGEILRSDSSPKRRKLEEKGPSMEKPAKPEPGKAEPVQVPLTQPPPAVFKQVEGRETIAPADLADRDSPAGPSGQELAAQILKEARDLKHRANKLKNLGMQEESLVLYFNAALKFMHVASIWEPHSNEGPTPVNATQCVQMYSDTAQLFEYCAKEYENVKDMAGVALSYKCVEMALMKAAFFKKPTKLKDFQDLQSSLQMLPAGSPLTPASDVDNLHNLAGTNNISCNLPVVLTHLLDYADDMNRAFDATRWSHAAFSDATEDEKAAIKNCVNFASGNIEKFVELTRITMGSIDR